MQRAFRITNTDWHVSGSITAMPHTPKVEVTGICRYEHAMIGASRLERVEETLEMPIRLASF